MKFVRQINSSDFESQNLEVTSHKVPKSIKVFTEVIQVIFHGSISI